MDEAATVGMEDDRTAEDCGGGSMDPNDRVDVTQPPFPPAPVPMFPLSSSSMCSVADPAGPDDDCVDS